MRLPKQEIIWSLQHFQKKPQTLKQLFWQPGLLDDEQLKGGFSPSLQALGGEEEGWEGVEGGREWGAPGCPRGQLKPMVVMPLMVERLRDASPFIGQTVMNSVTEAARN